MATPTTKANIAIDVSKPFDIVGFFRLFIPLSLMVVVVVWLVLFDPVIVGRIRLAMMILVLTGVALGHVVVVVVCRFVGDFRETGCERTYRHAIVPESQISVQDKQTTTSFSVESLRTVH